MGNGSKASGEEEEIADVAAEGEGFASGALKQVPFETYKGHDIASTGISNQGEYDGQNRIGNVMEMNIA